MRFLKGFEKTASEFHRMHEAMQPNRPQAGYSRKGIIALLRKRGIK